MPAISIANRRRCAQTTNPSGITMMTTTTTTTQYVRNICAHTWQSYPPASAVIPPMMRSDRSQLGTAFGLRIEWGGTQSRSHTTHTTKWSAQNTNCGVIGSAIWLACDGKHMRCDADDQKMCERVQLIDSAIPVKPLAVFVHQLVTADWQHCAKTHTI